ncbi:hypothetical protein MASR1M66_04320 [Aminivibrio sp.]
MTLSREQITRMEEEQVAKLKELGMEGHSPRTWHPPGGHKPVYDQFRGELGTTPGLLDEILQQVAAFEEEEGLPLPSTVREGRFMHSFRKLLDRINSLVELIVSAMLLVMVAVIFFR